METTTESRKLKIYCTTHQSIFEIEENAQIICEIKEHALSNNFPHGEFWEYCCDCRTFSPSKFGTGGKAGNVCPHCERQTMRRFLCDECKVICFDSDEETKGKLHKIEITQGIVPHCSGCSKSFVEAKISEHKCSDIDGLILTSLAECPFCRKPTNEEKQPKKVEPIFGSPHKAQEKSNSSQCSNCGHWGRADRAVCGKCGAQIGALGAGIAAGTATPKTQLLGSICPNCGAGNDADSVFCVNCGQALKTVPQSAYGTETVTVVNAKLPPNMPPIPVAPPNFSPVVVTPTVPQKISSDSKIGVFLIVGVVGFLIILGLIAFNSGKMTTTNNANNANNSNSNVWAINKEARIINTDVKLRNSAGKNTPEVGVLFEGTTVKILDSARSSDTGTLWYRVRVIKYGCSNVTGRCGKDNQYDSNEGWVYHENIGF